MSRKTKQRIRRGLAAGERCIAFAAGAVCLSGAAAGLSTALVLAAPLWVPAIVLREVLSDDQSQS